MDTVKVLVERSDDSSIETVLIDRDCLVALFSGEGGNRMGSPGSSALFVLISKGNLETIYRSGTILNMEEIEKTLEVE